MKRLHRLNLHTHKIRITYTKRRILNDDGEALLGDAQPNIARITMATIDPESGQKIPEELIRHNLGHEIAHYMFKLCGRDDLYEDETLVDLIGGMIAQILEQ